MPPVFIALEVEVIKVQMTGKSVIIEIDSNSKLGPEYIPNAQNKISLKTAKGKKQKRTKDDMQKMT